MLRRSLQHFHPRRQPWMTRQSYSHELASVMTFPLALALVEGGVVGVLAKKAFDIPPALFATIMAAPMFANLTSFFWARLGHGKPKVRFINVLQVGLLVAVGAIALLPTGWFGAVVLTLLVVVARCLISGIVTMRSTVWRMNYPRQVRGRLTSRLVLIHVLIVAAAPLIGYTALDYDPQAFRVLYPAAAVVALIGVFAYARIRLRGERALLRHEARPKRRVYPHADPGPIYEYNPGDTNNSADDAPRRDTIFTVLRDDWYFRNYLACQFIAGVGMQMCEVAAVYLIAERLTNGLTLAGWPVEYLTSILLSTTIPMGLAVVTMPMFARYFDRVHITTFRAFQAWWWVLMQLLTYIAAYTAFTYTGGIALPLVLITAARVVLGVSRGGGVLAFNLGHNDFAKKHVATLYMGLNVSLAGIRGILAGFLGMGLYVGWAPRTVWGVTLPGFQGIGPHVFGLTTALVVVALLGFTALSRSIVRNGELAPAD